MRISVLKYTLVLLSILGGAISYSQEQKVLFREDFNDLNSWESFYFPRIKKHTSYTIVSDGTNSYLKTSSNASASAILYKKEFSVYDFPFIMWRWKVENLYEKGNAKTKAGDDYPIRIYISFKYNPKEAGFFERLKYKSAKLLYGQYPPHSSLNYIWANKEHKEQIIENSYTDKSKMVVLQEGILNVGKWQTHEVNIIEDYERVFASRPPNVARIAIMNDSDNTGERSISYMDYIEVYKKEAKQ